MSSGNDRSIVLYSLSNHNNTIPYIFEIHSGSVRCLDTFKNKDYILTADSNG